MKLVVLSCDKYEPCWKPFFTLLEKYYPNHPEVYLINESKHCPYCKTISIDSDIWTERFREALVAIPDDEVLVMLDDFFIRQPVDEERINNIKLQDGVICYNFELNYRTPLVSGKEWDIQRNNQIFLNSCQPSIWNKQLLIERLQENQNAQEWEDTLINSPYIHYINNKDYIIDIGYRHQLIEEGGFGICRGKLSRECYDFLKKEGLADEIINHYTIL